jgi:ABC-type lipoprotein release transport system permease subunit
MVLILASGMLLVFTGVTMLVFKKQRWIAVLSLALGMGLLVLLPLLIVLVLE